MRKFDMFGKPLAVAAADGPSMPVDVSTDRGMKISRYAQQGPNDTGGMSPMPQGQGGGYGMPNDSGTGSAAQLPAELRGFCWGAFLMNWIWAIANRSFIGLLCLVPYVNIIMIFVMGFKGNEWAWQNRRWESIEQFKAVQKTWAMWGVGFMIFGLIAGILSGVMSAMMMHHGQ